MHTPYQKRLSWGIIAGLLLWGGAVILGLGACSLGTGKVSGTVGGGMPGGKFEGIAILSSTVPSVVSKTVNIDDFRKYEFTNVKPGQYTLQLSVIFNPCFLDKFTLGSQPSSWKIFSSGDVSGIGIPLRAGGVGVVGQSEVFTVTAGADIKKPVDIDICVY